MALDLLARPAGGARVDAQAGPLAARQAVPFEVEARPPPPLVEPAAQPPRAAPLAVALFAAVAVLCAVSEAVGQHCHRTWLGGEGLWQRVALWAPVVAMPYTALAAWCVWMRDSFQAGLPLHQWTRLYGAGAGAAAVLFATRPWSSACPWERRGDVFAFALTFTTLGSLKVISLVIAAHKLEELHRPQIALVVRRLSAVILLSAALGCFGISMGVPEGVSIELPGILVLGGLVTGLTSLPIAILCYLIACLCGVCGLLGAVARARCPGSAAQQRAARFVALTALGLALSLATSAALLIGLVELAVNHDFPELSNGWSALDALVDCLTVALFSGLIGPPSLRVLARDAFSAINCYTDDQLQAFYEKYLEYLDRAHVKWVRCGYLRRLAAAGDIMPRCQEVPVDQVLIGSSGFPLVRDGDKRRFVLSHPWLSKEHPDPSGVKLRLLVQQFDMMQASDDHAVFVDYMSLPPNDKMNPELQRLEAESGMPEPGTHPAVRTVVEEAQFKEALSAMEQIYSIGKTPVIVLPMNGDVDIGREYISRGWCLLECCLSMSFENITNAAIHEPVRRLTEYVEAMDGHKVEGFREAFKMTHFTNRGDADVVLKLFENTLNLADRR